MDGFIRIFFFQIFVINFKISFTVLEPAAFKNCATIMSALFGEQEYGLAIYVVSVVFELINLKCNTYFAVDNFSFELALQQKRSSRFKAATTEALIFFFNLNNYS